MVRRQIDHPPQDEFNDNKNLDTEQQLGDMNELLVFFPGTPKGRAAKENFINLCKEYLEEVSAQQQQSVSRMLEHHGTQRAAKHNDIHKIIGKLSTASIGNNTALFSRLGDRHYVTEMLKKYFHKIDFDPSNNSQIASIKNNPEYFDPDAKNEFSNK